MEAKEIWMFLVKKFGLVLSFSFGFGPKKKKKKKPIDRRPAECVFL